MGCRCRLHRRHDRLPIRPGLTGDGHEVVHPEDGSDATGREHVLGEPVADRSIGAGHVERRRKGCVQGELGGVGVGCRRRRSSGHGSMVRRRRDRNPGEKATTLGRLSGGRFSLGVAVGDHSTTTRRRARTCRPATVTTPRTKREVLNAETPEAFRPRTISSTSSTSSIRSRAGESTSSSARTTPSDAASSLVDLPVSAVSGGPRRRADPVRAVMRLSRLGLSSCAVRSGEGRRLAEPRVARPLDARPALDSVQSRTPMTSERMIGGVYWNSGAISTSAPARRANPTPARGRSPPAAACRRTALRPGSGGRCDPAR